MPILRTTRLLLAQLADSSELGSKAGGVSYDQAAFVQVLRRHGSREDGDAVLDAFLVDPVSRGWLLPVVRKLGDAVTAARLYEACVTGDRLRDGVSSEVLHCLGHLGHEPAESILWTYATDASDYYGHKDACLGLLDLPCRDLGPAIVTELSRYEGESLFPEYLPCLAVKTGNPLWIPRLIRWGREDASRDCNGGLILGLAMFGEPARARFLSVLWDPRWEAHESATGSRYWAFVGIRVLRIGMDELYRDARNRQGSDEHRHALQMLAALLEYWFDPIDLASASTPTEHARDLLAMLFRWSTPDRDDGLRGRASEAFPDHGHPIHDRLYRLERALCERTIYELELQQLRQP